MPELFLFAFVLATLTSAGRPCCTSGVHCAGVCHVGIIVIGGSTEASFFKSRVTQKKKLQSSTSLTVFTPGNVFQSKLLLPPPPSRWCSTLPPVYTQDPSLSVGINQKANEGTCRLPRGVPLWRPIFKLCPPGSALACKLINMINHGIFLPPPSNHPPHPHDKSRGKTPSAMQILTPTPFRRRLRVGVWARASSETVAGTLGSLSAGIAVGWVTLM